MMKITQKAKLMMLTAVAGLMGLPANAQYSQSVKQYLDNNYTSISASFELTKVAETLETDTATLVKALNDWKEAGATSTGAAMFQLKVGDQLLPENAAGYNSNFGGLWIGADGTPKKDVPNGRRWHAESAWNTAKNYYNINLYQQKDSLEGGEKFNGTFVLTYNGKQATFDITYHAMKRLAVPAQEVINKADLDSKFTKVGSADINVVRTDIQGYDNTKLKFYAKDWVSKFGITATDEAKALGEDDYSFLQSADLTKMVYTIGYDQDNGVATDTLSNTYTAGKPGFWFRPTLYPAGDVNQGEESPVLGAAPYSSDNKYFVENFKFDGDSIVCSLGQYPEKVKPGSKYEAHVYFVYGDKYFEVNFNMECVEAPTKHLSEMTKVGEQTLTFEHNKYEKDYQIYYEDLDLKSIMDKLGVSDTTSVKFLCLKDEDTFYAGSQNAGEYGYYVNAEGYHSVWTQTNPSENCPLFITFEKKNHPERLGSGLFEGLQKNIGDSYLTKVYYIAGDKYYEFTVINKVVTLDRPAMSEWEVVETRDIKKLVKAEKKAGVYYTDANQTAYSLTKEEAEQILGTTELPMLYCVLADSLQVDGDLYAPYTSNNYYCGPTPGVWLGKQGQGHAHSGNEEAPVGICWLQSDANGMKAGDFFVFQAPNVWNTGDNYKATLYLVNEKTYKMIKLNFDLTFVDEVQSAETVGSENIAAYAVDGEDTPINIDLTKAADALGVTTDDLLDDLSGYFKVKSAAGTFSAGPVPSSGYTFGMNGEYDSSDNGTFGIIYDESNGWVAFCNTTPESETWDIQTAICFDVDGKRYIYNIHFVDANSYTTGIKDIEVADKNSGKIFNLQGMEVKAPVKGQIYIQNGKKIIKK